MIRRAEELKKTTMTEVKRGKGELQYTHILEQEKDEFSGKGRVYAKVTIKQGDSIGYHQHVGDFEAYYILQGEGTANDNGTKSFVKAGDLVLTKNGESHSLENTGDSDLEFMALILFD